MDRASFLMALSDLQALRIRASFTSHGQYLASLSRVALDRGHDLFAATAALDRMARVKAAAVEVCQCPDGYAGTSCEACAPGYSKSAAGFYLGQCLRSQTVSQDLSHPFVIH